MRNLFLSLITVMICSIAIYPQAGKTDPAAAKPAAETKASVPAKSGEQKEDPFPTFAVNTEEFLVGAPTFNKRTDIVGKGEVLEVQFTINRTNDSKLDLYVFVIASREDLKWKSNSLGTKEKYFPEKNIFSEFVPSPGGKDNFEFDVNGEKVLKRQAKNYKLGVDPASGQPYTLLPKLDKLVVRTNHLVEYKRKYQFFNTATILIYDAEGKILYRQVYDLKGIRTR